MSIGLYAWFGYAEKPDELMRPIRDAGFDSVLIWGGDEFTEASGGKEKQIDAARRAGLFVENVHMPFYGIANGLWMDNEEGERAMGIYRRLFRECAALEVPCVILHTCSGDHSPDPNELGKTRLEALLELAEKGGFTIAIENLRRVDHLAYLFDAIASPTLTFCYDSGHAVCRGYHDDLPERFGGRLASLHLHDNDGKTDLHQLPGEGIINWTSTMARLKATGYAGPISLEVTNEQTPSLRDLPMREYLALAAAKARELERMMRG